ncbi:hypothetical protein OMR07_11130 [Methylobacterium organophilum]|nr:hypothetical protein [Methylobacterium organophilum]
MSQNNSRIVNRHRICIQAVFAIIASFFSGNEVCAMDRDIKSGEAHIIELDAIHGVAYYTDQRDGFLLVLTMAEEGGAIVRFEALLSRPNQSVNISAPRTAGNPAVQMTFVRTAGGIRVSQMRANPTLELPQSDLEVAEKKGSHASVNNQP